MKPVRTIPNSNYIATSVTKDRRSVRITIVLKDKETGSWIEFDAEQFDALLASLHRARGEME